VHFVSTEEYIISYDWGAFTTTSIYILSHHQIGLESSVLVFRSSLDHSECRPPLFGSERTPPLFGLYLKIFFIVD
jgi:hypothetical protein